MLVVASVAHLLLLAGEYFGRHPTRGSTVAAHLVTRGRYAPVFWGAAVAPVVVAAGLAAADWSSAGTGALALVAGLLVQPALLVYESVFVRAGQDVPLS